MSLFTAKGAEAKQSASKKGVDLKTAYIRLKENESVRVRILGVEDYVEYKSHNSFELGIFPQPCRQPLDGEEDPLCIASNVEGYEGLRAKKRYIFAMFDIDKKQLRYFDATKNQATKIIGQIEEYADSIDEIAFNFKRTGQKTDTSYDLNPILKLDDAGKAGFAEGEELEVEMSHFESVLIPRTVAKQIEELKKAGFPVEEYFDVEPAEGEGEPEPTNVEGNEDPTKNF